VFHIRAPRGGVESVRLLTFNLTLRCYPAV